MCCALGVEWPLSNKQSVCFSQSKSNFCKTVSVGWKKAFYAPAFLNKNFNTIFFSLAHHRALRLRALRGESSFVMRSRIFITSGIFSPGAETFLIKKALFFSNEKVLLPLLLLFIYQLVNYDFSSFKVDFILYIFHCSIKKTLQWYIKFTSFRLSLRLGPYLPSWNFSLHPL